jgi:hypothetical protein
MHNACSSINVGHCTELEERWVDAYVGGDGHRVELGKRWERDDIEVGWFGPISFGWISSS